MVANLRRENRNLNLAASVRAFCPQPPNALSDGWAGAKFARPFCATALRLGLLALLGLAALCLAGCRTSEQPESARYASVVIHGNTPGQIATITDQVFHEHGFRVVESELPELVFEKRGSGLNEMAYGSWVGERRIWLRAKVRIVPLGEMKYRVECQAYFVSDIGGPTEEELSSRPRRGPYQKMLEEVGHRLGRKGPPGGR
jgi:hypothetical protein